MLWTTGLPEWSRQDEDLGVALAPSVIVISQRPPCLSFFTQKALGIMAFPSRSALLPQVLHYTSPESILLLSTKPPRLLPTLTQKHSQFQSVPRGSGSIIKKALVRHSNVSVLLFRPCLPAFNEDGGLAAHIYIICRGQVRGAMELPFEGAGSRWAFYQGTQSTWNLESGKAGGFPSIFKLKVRKFPHLSSLQLDCPATRSS